MFVDYGFTAFYMGDTPTVRNSNSNYAYREGYLERTVHNMARYCKHIVVYVCNDHDAGIVNNVLATMAHRRSAPAVAVVKLEVADSMMLPLEACKHVQRNATLPTEAIVYWTEADQLLHVNVNQDELVNLLRQKGVYASMHRLEELYGSSGNNRGPLAEYHGRSFVAPNTSRRIPSEPSFSDTFYISPTPGEGFAGAFLMSMGNMRNVVFGVHEGLRVESTVFSCFRAMPCVKTKRLLDLFIHHLSGYEYHQQLAGVGAGDVKPSP